VRKIAERFSAPESLLRTKRGFSVLEVLITAAIIGIITAMVTLKYGSFNNLILLKNQAYQIALELREMQSRSISAVGRSEDFRRPYGLYFATSDPGRYRLFIDMDDPGDSGYGYYNAGEELEIRSLDSRFRISRLCNASNCSLSTLSVMFQRPNFDAIINAGTVANAAIEIVTLSNSSSTRRVEVNAAGQITVQ
jgi:prepilin-type N-terminal cleavage/methylation domain-containing protein